MNWLQVKKVAREYMPDWISIIVLAILAGFSTQLPPNHRFIQPDEREKYMYPYEEHATLPSWTVPLIALLPAIVIFVIFKLLKLIYPQDLHRLILGVTGSFLFAVLITNAFKSLAGRPRPHFFRRCFQDGQEIVDDEGYYQCDIKDAWRSFPSGHASETTSGLMFLSLFFFTNLNAWGRLMEAALVLFPLFCGGLVSITRVIDYYHHWGDVVAGYIIGLICGLTGFYYYFEVSPAVRQKVKVEFEETSTQIAVIQGHPSAQV